MFLLFLAKTINSMFHSARSEINRVSATEQAALVFHGVKHSHSYLSQSCTTNLPKVVSQIRLNKHTSVRKLGNDMVEP
jgi:hypothetical protein